MLAERRKKTKWVINPTKKPLWASDSSGIKFGKEMMEKMGWSTGKGLGSKEQGIVEPLKVSYKNDTKGMGFKGNDDDWIEYQDEFNSLLSELSNGVGSSTTEQEKIEIKSLEEKSKKSKARVHYQKFTRGKDLSRYSENDLACILGTNRIKEKKESKEKEKKLVEEPETENCLVTSFGVSTINSGSINDYFKKKISEKKGSYMKEECENEIIQNNYSENTPENDFESESSKKKSKKRKHESVELEEINEFEIVNGDVELHLHQVKHKKKKKKEIDEDGDCEIEKKDAEELDVRKSKKKSNDKRKNCEDWDDSEIKKVGDDLDDKKEGVEVIDDNKTKKKKKSIDCSSKDKTEVLNDSHKENVPENNDSIKTEEEEKCNDTCEETSKRKKSKKKTKEKELYEKCEDGEKPPPTETKKKKKKKDSFKIEENLNTDDIPVKESCLEEIPVKKKKKKSKKELVDEENGDIFTEDIMNSEVKKIKSKKKKKKNKEELENGYECANGIISDSITPSVDTETVGKRKNDEIEVKNERLKETTKTVIHSHKPEFFKSKKMAGMGQFSVEGMDPRNLESIKDYSSKKVLKMSFNVAIEEFNGSNITSLPGYGTKVNKSQKR